MDRRGHRFFFIFFLNKVGCQCPETRSKHTNCSVDDVKNRISSREEKKKNRKKKKKIEQRGPLYM